MVSNTQPQGISLKPSDAVAGGLIDMANLLVTKARFILFTYPGTSTQTVAAQLTLKADDDAEYEQIYSSGDPKNFVPSRDGTEIVPVGAVTALAESANYVFLAKQLVAAGFPEDRIENKITFLEGLYAFWRRVKQPERQGLANSTRKNPERDPTTLVPTEIHNMPWEPAKRGTPAMNGAAAPARAAAPKAAATNGARANGNGATAAAPAAAPAADGDIETKAQTWLTDVALVEMPIIDKKALVTGAFRAFAQDPDRNAIVALFNVDKDASFIEGLAAMGLVGYDAAEKSVSAA